MSNLQVCYTIASTSFLCVNNLPCNSNLSIILPRVSFWSKLLASSICRDKLHDHELSDPPFSYHILQHLPTYQLRQHNLTLSAMDCKASRCLRYHCPRSLQTTLSKTYPLKPILTEILSLVYHHHFVHLKRQIKVLSISCQFLAKLFPRSLVSWLLGDPQALIFKEPRSSGQVL